MDLFEAKSDRGLERRVDEGDLRNLYRAGFLHLDSPVRRSGSPNWFRVDEIFPHFVQIASPKKYSANLKKSPSTHGLRNTLLFIGGILILVVLLSQLSQRLASQNSPASTPAVQAQPAR